MCGIIGIFNNKDASKQIKLALPLLKNRGNDAFGIYSDEKINTAKTILNLPKSNSNNILGHTLHAVVNHIPQPIKQKNKQLGILSANCEIYNWQELNKKYNFSASNDSELLLQFLDNFKVKKLDELDGIFAFAYINPNNQTVTLTRDLIGVNPLWFSHTKDNFAFASEKKVLEKLNYTHIQELNPRQILIYNIASRNLQFINKDFFKIKPEHKLTKEQIKNKLSKLLDSAIQKRIPNKKFGLLFSGGIDSVFIAQYLKQHNIDFTCYTAVLDSKTPPSDLIFAKKAAKMLDLNLKIKKVKLNNIPKYLKTLVPLIEDSNVVKVGVGLTFYLACEMAKQDKCKVIFSGLGSEEIFAGYARHKNSQNINEECLSGLRKTYERDLYRDNVITMFKGLEIRIPFLDKKLVEFALKIPEKFKVKNNLGKFILREIAKDNQIPSILSFRKKVATQYGSRINNALEKLTKQNNFKRKSEYLKIFYPAHNLNLGILFSGGKDSTYVIQIMKKQNYNVSCLITIQSENPNSYMFHTPAIDKTKLQAKAMNIPLIIHPTKGKKEIELEDLKTAIITAKKKYSLDGIVTGAVFSTYQRNRVEKICEDLGLKVFSPLWHKPQLTLMTELLEKDFKFIFTRIATEGLDKSWLNKVITKKHLTNLIKLNEKIGINVAGEGGEFESLVLDCPLFISQKLKIISAKSVMDEENSGILKIENCELIDK